MVNQRTYRTRPHRMRWVGWWLTWLISLPGMPQSAYAQVPDDSIRTGLGVFGTALGIHGKDTLTIQGDVVLENASIVGTGVLSLTGKRPQRLRASHSVVQNLHIRNSTQVTLQGDLRVEKSLSIQQGTFDTRTAHLTLSRGCDVQQQAGGQLLQYELKPDRHPLTRHSEVMPAWAMLTKTAHTFGHWVKKYRQLSSVSLLVIQQQSRPPFPPPELN